MNTETFVVFRSTEKRDRTYLIVTREGRTGWSHVPLAEGTRVVFSAGGEASGAVLSGVR